MMSFSIFIDSTADIPVERAKEMGIGVVPLTVQFGQQEYKDGIDLTPASFFEKLQMCEDLPKTSQASVQAFLEAFEKVDEEEDILGLFISQKLSGTYQSAHIAKQTLGRENIYLVDTGSGSFGSMMLIEEAVRLRAQGMSAKETAQRLDALKKRLYIFAAVDTLKYLQKGGRLPSTIAIVGGLLKIKPILGVHDGEIHMAGKVRGNASAYQKIVEIVQKHGVDLAYRPIIGAAQCPENAAQFTRTVQRELGLTEWGTCEIGVVIGTHTGPGCVGIAFIAKDE